MAGPGPMGLAGAPGMGCMMGPMGGMGMMGLMSGMAGNGMVGMTNMAGAGGSCGSSCGPGAGAYAMGGGLGGGGGMAGGMASAMAGAMAGGMAGMVAVPGMGGMGGCMGGVPGMGFGMPQMGMGCGMGGMGGMCGMGMGGMGMAMPAMAAMAGMGASGQGHMQAFMAAGANAKQEQEQAYAKGLAIIRRGAAPAAEEEGPSGSSVARTDPNHHAYRPANTEPVPGVTDKRYDGHIRLFIEDELHGYGFIKCAELGKKYPEKDVFLHRNQRAGFKQGDAVNFGVFMNFRGMPQATDLRKVRKKGAEDFDDGD